MKFKDKVKIADELIADQFDKKMERLQDWLTAYKRLVGFALIILAVICLSQGWYTEALIIACTVHLQVCNNYFIKTSLGIPLWKKATQQTTSETGSEATLPLAKPQ